MSRQRTPFVSGTITNNPLAIGGTTLNSAALASLPAVASPNVAVLVLDPAGAGGVPEVVHVTAHTASATSATILRGMENTTARAHNLNTPFIHAPTTLDFGYTKGADLASAATLTLPNSSEDYFNVTGTTTITSISGREGGRRLLLKFSSALTLTHNANIILTGGANIVTVANQVVELVAEDTNVWRQVGSVPIPSAPAGELGGTWASPTVDSIHGPEGLVHHDHASGLLTNFGGSVNLTVQDTIYDSGSISIPTGWWMIVVEFQVQSYVAAQNAINLYIRKGTSTNVANREVRFVGTVAGVGHLCTLTIFEFVSSTTTYKGSASAASGASSSVAMSARIQAMKIG